MDLNQARTLARSTMDHHGLTDWTFSFDRAVSRFGVCIFTTKTITMSKVLTELNPENEVMNTLLHEIAHALVGFGEGHGWRWYQKAQSIGCTGRTTHDAITPVPKHTGTCSNGHTITTDRLTAKAKTKACGTCCRKFNRGRYSVDHVFNWNLTSNTVTV